MVKMAFPKTEKTTMIMNEINKALYAVLFCCEESRSLVNPTNTGVLAIGFMIAKKPRKTLTPCSKRPSTYIFFCYEDIVNIPDAKILLG
jgi:hypothetical protein